MTRQQEVEPLAALAGSVVALAEAARYAGGGVGAVGSRVGRGGVALGRRAGPGAALTLIALGRAVLHRPDGGPGTTWLRRARVSVRPDRRPAPEQAEPSTSAAVPDASVGVARVRPSTGAHAA